MTRARRAGDAFGATVMALTVLAVLAVGPSGPSAQQPQFRTETDLLNIVDCIRFHSIAAVEPHIAGVPSKIRSVDRFSRLQADCVRGHHGAHAEHKNGYALHT